MERGQRVSEMDVMELAMRGAVRLCKFFDGIITKFDIPELDVMIHAGPPYSFRGFIQIPKRVISPTGGAVEFDEVNIIEVVDSIDDQLPEVNWPNIYGNSSVRLKRTP